MKTIMAALVNKANCHIFSYTLSCDNLTEGKVTVQFELIQRTRMSHLVYSVYIYIRHI